MKTQFYAALLCAVVSVVLPSFAFAAGERAATKAEIEKIAVGRTVSGAMTYNKDGSYRYKGKNPGTYKISNGNICVAFAEGGRRCDRIVTDGSS